MIKKIHEPLTCKIKHKHKQENIHNMTCVMSKIRGMMCKRVTPEGHMIDSMVRDGINQEVTVET